MKSLSLVLAFAAAVSCDPYTIGQVASGWTNGGFITGVDYGHGVVSGVGAIGNRGVVYSGLHHFGKRDADADAYTVGQVYGGLPIHNAYATGHPHNVGYVSHVSYPSVYAYGK